MANNNYKVLDLVGNHNALNIFMNPDKPSRLNDKETRVYVISHAELLEHILYLRSVMAGDEREKLDNYRIQSLKTGFICSRGFVKVLLGYFLQIYPSLIEFTYTQNGKPEIPTRNNAKGIKFNVSHSDIFISCILSIRNDVGVDIEYVRPIKDMEKIVKRFFNQEEIDLFFKMQDKERQKSFYKIWTRKEAIAKAQGIGILQSMHRTTICAAQSKEHENMYCYEAGDSIKKVKLLDTRFLKKHNLYLAAAEAIN